MSNNRQSDFARGYQQAMTDLLDAGERGGILELITWIHHNCAPADYRRAKDLLASEAGLFDNSDGAS